MYFLLSHKSMQIRQIQSVFVFIFKCHFDVIINTSLVDD